MGVIRPILLWTLVVFPCITYSFKWDSSDVINSIPDDLFYKLFQGYSIIHREDMDEKFVCSDGTYMMAMRIKTVGWNDTSEKFQPSRVTAMELMCSDFFFTKVSTHTFTLSLEGDWEPWSVCDGGYQIGISIQIYSAFDPKADGIWNHYVYGFKQHCSGKQVDMNEFMENEKGELLAHPFKHGQGNVHAQVCFAGEALTGLWANIEGRLEFNSKEIKQFTLLFARCSPVKNPSNQCDMKFVWDQVNNGSQVWIGVDYRSGHSGNQIKSFDMFHFDHPVSKEFVLLPVMLAHVNGLEKESSLKEINNGVATVKRFILDDQWVRENSAYEEGCTFHKIKNDLSTEDLVCLQMVAYCGIYEIRFNHFSGRRHLNVSITSA